MSGRTGAYSRRYAASNACARSRARAAAGQRDADVVASGPRSPCRARADLDALDRHALGLDQRARPRRASPSTRRAKSRRSRARRGPASSCARSPAARRPRRCRARTARPGSSGTRQRPMPTSFISAAACMRAGAAVGDEREVARVVAALDRDRADAAGHAVVGHAHDRRARLLHARARAGRPRAARWRAPRRRGPSSGRRRRRRRTSASRRPSTRLASVTVGSLAAAAVAGRARASRRRVSGPTCSSPPPSTRARLPPPAPIVWMSIIGTRSGMRKPRSVWSEVRGRPPGMRHDVEARAAHVGRDHVVEPGDRGHVAGRHHARRRARQREVGRPLARGGAGHHAAAGLHEQHIAAGSRRRAGGALSAST